MKIDTESALTTSARGWKQQTVSLLIARAIKEKLNQWYVVPPKGTKNLKSFCRRLNRQQDDFRFEETKLAFGPRGRKVTVVSWREKGGK